MSHIDEGALHAYLDGEATAAERSALDAHLAQCAACRERLAEERALRGRAAELLGRARPPERAMPPLQALTRRRRRWILPLGWAASVVLALGTGYALRDSAVESSGGPEADDVLAIASEPAAEEQTAPAEPAPFRPVAPPAAPTPAPPPVPTPVPRDQAAQNAALARREAERDTTGVVAISGAPALRAVTPRAAAGAPAPAAEPTAEAAVERRDLAELRGRLVATEWPIIQRRSARERLGTEPVGVPGLAVRDIRGSPSPDDDTVLLEQTVDGSTVIQLYQRRSTERAERDSDRYGTSERLARFIGGLRVEIAGPLSHDSLNRLLEQVRPLP